MDFFACAVGFAQKVEFFLDAWGLIDTDSDLVFAFEFGPQEMFDAQSVFATDKIFAEGEVDESVSVLDLSALFLVDAAAWVDQLEEGGAALFERGIGLLAKEDRACPDGVSGLIDGLVSFDQGAELAAFAEEVGDLLCEGLFVLVVGSRFGGTSGFWGECFEGELIFEGAGWLGFGLGCGGGGGFGCKACDGWLAFWPSVGCGLRFEASAKGRSEKGHAAQSPQTEALCFAWGGLCGSKELCGW